MLDAADYDGDDKADLAVGTSSSYVRVFRGGFGKSKGEYGGAYGVRPAILSGADTGPMNLHSGDVNGDDIADLVVDGYERDSADGEYHWNANYYVPGSASGLTASGQQKLPAGLITDIGDVNSDGFGDIVIGMRFDADSGVPGSRTGGLVNVLHGSPSGPNGNRQSFTQDSPGVPGGSERYDGFGSELDLGDVNGDGHLDWPSAHPASPWATRSTPARSSSCTARRTAPASPAPARSSSTRTPPASPAATRPMTSSAATSTSPT